MFSFIFQWRWLKLCLWISMIHFRQIFIFLTVEQVFLFNQENSYSFNGSYTKIAVNALQERTMNLFTTIFFRKWDRLHIQVRAEKNSKGRKALFQCFNR